MPCNKRILSCKYKQYEFSKTEDIERFWPKINLCLVSKALFNSSTRDHIFKLVYDLYHAIVLLYFVLWQVNSEWKKTKKNLNNLSFYLKMFHFNRSQLLNMFSGFWIDLFQRFPSSSVYRVWGILQLIHEIFPQVVLCNLFKLCHYGF